MAAPPLDSPCDGPVSYPGDTKLLEKSSKTVVIPDVKWTVYSGDVGDDTYEVSCPPHPHISTVHIPY